MIRSNLPVILLKGLVLLPYEEVRIELNNDISKKVVEISKLYHDNEVLIVSPINELEESPDVSDLPKIGVVGIIKSAIELPNGITRVVIVGKSRVKVFSYVNYSNDKDVLESIIEGIDSKDESEVETTAIHRKLMKELNSYINKNPYISNSIISQAKGIEDLGKLTDVIANFIPLSFEKKVNLMLDSSPLSRGKFLIKELTIENAVVDLENKIETDLQTSLDTSQKEFILREKIKLMREELGEEDKKESDVDIFRDKLAASKMPIKIKKKIEKEIERYSLTPDVSPEISVIRNYIDCFLNFPWYIYTKDEKNLNKIESKLNENHYGLTEAKNRIIEYIAVKSRSENVVTPVICLVGPPGVGKTTFAESIATALNRNFVKISLGGMSDSAELVGHRRTYIGSNPGKIITSLIKSGSSNPIFLLDEIDKLSKDFKSDPASTLLDVLDQSQNSKFIDNYLDEEVDLSKVFFILTANDAENIPLALYDRLEFIYIAGYTDKEKLSIAKNYLIKKSLINNGIMNGEIQFDDEAIKVIIEEYTKENGVRELSRIIDKIIRKVITDYLKSKLELKDIIINKNDVYKYLKKPLYPKVKKSNVNSKGRITGLAYMPNGGSTVDIEVISYRGSGKIKSTGRIGDMINESINISLSYIKSNSEIFNIDNRVFARNNFHINFREGAVSKDGPSAGITITTCFLSYLLNKKIPANISMTGEMTLNGDVLKIGGLKEKCLAAIRMGIDTIYLSKQNSSDVNELEEEIQKSIKFIFVDNYMEIYNDLFK